MTMHCAKLRQLRADMLTTRQKSHEPAHKMTHCLSTINSTSPLASALLYCKNLANRVGQSVKAAAAAARAAWEG